MTQPISKPTTSIQINNQVTRIKTFDRFPLSKNILKALSTLNYRTPTEIQSKTLPHTLKTNSVLATSRTGSGKTLAFLLPTLQVLSSHKESAVISPRGLILAPTRELAIQIFNLAKKLSQNTSLRISILHGGHSLQAQFSALQNHPDLIIATPGRMAHILVEMSNDLSFSELVTISLDEVDRFFEMGLMAQIKEIFLAIEKDNSNRYQQIQTLFFSATVPKKLVDFTKNIFNGTKKIYSIKLDDDFKVNPNLKINFLRVLSEQKVAALNYLLKDVDSIKRTKMVIFVATRFWVELLKATVEEELVEKISICYSSLDSRTRMEELEQFRNGNTRILVVTDVAARGLDIPELDVVINFHMPDSVKLFIHRIGRVGRTSNLKKQSENFGSEEGFVYNLCSKDEMGVVFEVEEYLERDFLKEGILGCIENRLLESESENFIKKLERDNEVNELYRSCLNSMQLYKKTKGKVKKEAITKAKRVQGEVAKRFIFGQNEKSSFLTDIKEYKPKHTVFELHQKEETLGRNAAESIRKETEIYKRNQNLKNLKNLKRKKKDLFADLRSFAQSLPNKDTKRKKEDKKSVYLSYFPDNYEKSKVMEQHLESNLLEMNPDEARDLNEKARFVKWDQKKKKYIKSTFEEHVKNKRVKDESGGKINLKNRGEMYKKWKKENKLDEKRLNMSEKRVGFGKMAADVERFSKLYREKESMKGENEVINDESKLTGVLGRIEKKKEKNRKGRKELRKKEKQEKDKLSNGLGKKGPKPSRRRGARSRIVVK
eukprot:snap_masked-scaffold_67-processed-gene-0.31-mRNA-1 protein AED:0.24 eAED:0.26 QI:0/-1/0/1/-1/1/1/0/771